MQPLPEINSTRVEWLSLLIEATLLLLRTTVGMALSSGNLMELMAHQGGRRSKAVFSNRKRKELEVLI